MCRRGSFLVRVVLLCCFFLGSEQAFGLRSCEQDHSTDNGEYYLGKHIRAVVQSAVDELVLRGEAVPERAEGMPDKNAAQEVAHKAQEKRSGRTEHPAGDTLASEHSRCADSGISEYVVKREAGYESSGRKSPAQYLAEINEELLDAPEMINENANDAWFIKVENVTEQVEELMAPEEYEAFCAEEE